MQGIKQHSQDGGSNHIYRADEGANRKTPLKFWEIDHFFKCPVVGMCLTLSEQKQLLKKTDFSVKSKSPFELHEILVASSEIESRLSKKVDNLLNRKLGKEAASLLELDNEAFMGHFKAAFKAGVCIGVSWAAAINPNLPIELKREIFGDIHMAMHWSGDQSIKLKQRLTRQEKEINGLRRSTKEITRHRRSLQKENMRLKQSHAELRTSLAAMERDKTKLEEELATLHSRFRYAEIKEENRTLKEKLDALRVNSNTEQRLIASLEEKNMRLSFELERQQYSNRRFRKEAQEIIGEAFTLNRCDVTCPSFDLCQKRILIVGGITRMEYLYRELIKSNGGVFEYHDGYMKKGVKKLECRLRRADVVVCPVSCNSHAACSIVKNLAKKHNKTVHMLANSSLSAVSQAIWGTSDKGTINYG
jgi:hypothetical protein